jgi:hypothetical protein
LPRWQVADPVHWYEQPSSAHASAAPYWVGTKNGLVVTWLTNTNFHFGVVGKFPIPPAALVDDDEHAASRAAAAPVALARPAPFSSRRRMSPLMFRVSMASSTTGSISCITDLQEIFFRTERGAP